MKKQVDWRALLLAFGAVTMCIAILLLGRFQTGERPATAVDSEEFHAPEDQSPSDIPLAQTGIPPGPSAHAVSGSSETLTIKSPWRSRKVSDSVAERSHAPVGSELRAKLATNVPPFAAGRSNHKDWNHAESVGNGQTEGKAASEVAVPDANVQALLVAMKSAQSTLLIEQKELRLKLADADESEKEEIRQAQKHKYDAFLAHTDQLREQLRQLTSSKRKR